MLHCIYVCGSEDIRGCSIFEVVNVPNLWRYPDDGITVPPSVSLILAFFITGLAALIVILQSL